MDKKNTFQVSIIGGGLAGLSLAIQLADAGYSCVLFEKNNYPFHKVCGEYISMESYAFLERIGLNLATLNLPEINRLQVSSPAGKLLKHKLDLGGFGISRHLLDFKLAALAKQKGVLLLEGCSVSDVKFDGKSFFVETSKGNFTSEICVAAWGKKSNLDKKLRGISSAAHVKNYVGIKYHIKMDFPADLIELHNFEGGYCGISRIEEEKSCMCYLTDSENLKKYNGVIKKMEEAVLFKNPLLKAYFSKANFLFDAPLAISQIKIGYKGAVENNILMLGDAAGNIAPLSGNGMSMALRSSSFLNTELIEYFDKKISRAHLEKKYQLFWEQEFKKRIQFSAFLQQLLKNTTRTNFAISILKTFPFLRNIVVKSTHGKPF